MCSCIEVKVVVTYTLVIGVRCEILDVAISWEFCFRMSVLNSIY